MKSADAKRRIAVIIPTYNAQIKLFTELLTAINNQSIKISHTLIIDSESSNSTRDVAAASGFEVISVKRSEFNHGKTRDYALRYLLEKDETISFVIFLTQDALPTDIDSFAHLIAAFDDASVATAYGRQLTGKTSSLLEKVSRAFNYTDQSGVKNYDDIATYGMNTPFLSNSFAAYRVEDYITAGGFSATNFGEDMLIAARFLLNRRAISYRASAAVYHSHSYSITGEYERGRAIAIMHNNNEWLLETFGKAEKRGSKMILSAKIYLIPFMILEAIPKLIGYKLNRWRKVLK